MLTKTRALESIRDMPDQLTIEDIVERLQSLEDLEVALDAIRQGNTRPHESVLADARKRLTER